MPGPAPQPASPPTFHLRIRLTDLSGSAVPFANRDYEIEWGGLRVVWGQKTTAHGEVRAELDHGSSEGVLALGEVDNAGTFVPKLKIPLKAVPSPAPKPPGPEDPEDVLFFATEAGRALIAYYAHAWAWRLSNLGHLPGLWQLDFPVDGQRLERVGDAVWRYAHKHGLHLDSISPESLAAELVHIHELLSREHDGV